MPSHRVPSERSRSRGRAAVFASKASRSNQPRDRDAVTVARRGAWRRWRTPRRHRRGPRRSRHLAKPPHAHRPIGRDADILKQGKPRAMPKALLGAHQGIRDGAT